MYFGLPDLRGIILDHNAEVKAHEKDAFQESVPGLMVDEDGHPSGAPVGKFAFPIFSQEFFTADMFSEFTQECYRLRSNFREMFTRARLTLCSWFSDPPTKYLYRLFNTNRAFPRPKYYRTKIAVLMEAGLYALSQTTVLMPFAPQRDGTIKFSTDNIAHPEIFVDFFGQCKYCIISNRAWTTKCVSQLRVEMILDACQLWIQMWVQLTCKLRHFQNELLCPNCLKLL